MTYIENNFLPAGVLYVLAINATAAKQTDRQTDRYQDDDNKPHCNRFRKCCCVF